MNFFKILEREPKRIGKVEVYPAFSIEKDTDLMVKGKNFYAVWDEKNHIWSMDEYRLREMVDEELDRYCDEHGREWYEPLYMKYDVTNSWYRYKKFIQSCPDCYRSLDQKVTFSDMEVKKEDYVSKKLPYTPKSMPIPAYETIIGTLYSPEERQKIEWAIGAIFCGASTKIQKFLVLYGKGGTGKGTILEIIMRLLPGYWSVFNSQSLASGNNQFSMEPFKDNPLIALQTDGNLSKIEDNTKLNQIVAHEVCLINEKNKPQYKMKVNSFLFMASNNPVQITDAKSGLIRRLIDVNPTGQLIEFDKYTSLMKQIDFEIPGIAKHCMDIFKSLGPGAYNKYKPQQMIYSTNHFFNFMEENYFIFSGSNGITVKNAYEMYRDFCDRNGITHPMPSHVFRSEIQNYFDYFDELKHIDGKLVRSWLSGFRQQEFNYENVNTINKKNGIDIPDWLHLTEQPSLFDKVYADSVAQIASRSGKPFIKWEKVKKTLKDIDTHEIHFCKFKENDDGYCPEIVVDFDFKNEKGEKDPTLNVLKAAEWPPTYAELSKGGGLHLHYIWDGGDTHDLLPIYSENIEIKTFNGGSSLRRKLSKCNDIPIATLSSGLPMKGDRNKNVVNTDNIKDEEHLRNRIIKALRKEYPPGNTSSNVDYIYKDLEKAYNSGMSYDITDMKPDIIVFAGNSTNQSSYCLDLVAKMHFQGKNEATADSNVDKDGKPIIAFLDTEVYPNLFLIVWKFAGPDHKCVRMFNPKPQDIDNLLELNLVGFNSNRYDKYMIYAAKMGYSNQGIFDLSQKIINDKNFKPFPGCYNELANMFYTDVYDYLVGDDKMSLKKWEYKLKWEYGIDIPHKEMELDWDKPVPEDKWDEVARYCENDVKATEQVWNVTQKQFRAREMLATISKILTGQGNVGMTTNQLTERIIFLGDKYANKQFVYPDLAKEFPGYEYNERGFPKESFKEEIDAKAKVLKSRYLGRYPSEGGRVFANPGMYFNVWTFDVASMHPSSIKAENGFGKYTKNFCDLLDIRLHIKHKEYDKVAEYFDGALVPFLGSPDDAKDLSYALKIAINSVYGLTSAKFPNAFRDERNVDNWVAKRGALMMIKLQEELEAKNVTVVHIKTDSIKVENPSEEIKQFIFDFGKHYGYTFEVESVYERICLVNKSTYIARCDPKLHPDPEERGKWTSTGDQFLKKSNPYVFKSLFSGEPIEFSDLCELKNVKVGSIYLDMNESNPEEHNYIFIGKTGMFCPVVKGAGGGEMKCKGRDGKYSFVQGSSGYLWMEADVVKNLHLEDKIDMNYFRNLADQAINDISQFGPFDLFIDTEAQITHF